MTVEPKPGRGADASRKHDLVIWAILLAAAVVFPDFLYWFNGGGVWALASALSAVQARAAAVDVAGYCLDCIIATPLAVAAFGLVWAADARPTSRGAVAIAMLVVMGGTFALSLTFEDRVFDNYMADHGYARCPARDHEVGRGKGRVWFRAYVLRGATCAAPALR